MKKSKIIVPALGIIALSTAASITGTVAWFTASRSATITAGTFAVTKTTNNLSVTLAAGVGTTVDNTTKAVSLKTNYKLTDASFDHKENKLLVYNPNGEGTAISESFGVDTATETIADVAHPENDPNVRSEVKTGPNAQTVLSVVTWKMSVTVSFGSVSGDMALYLSKDSWVKLSDEPASPVYYTAKGFRVAFVPFESEDADNGAVSKVWADLQTKANCKHVDHLTSADPQNPTEAQKAITGVAYELEGAHDIIDSDYTTAVPGDSALNAAESAARSDYLGKFTWTANTEKTLNYRVVCWYEGTDPEIKNRELAAEYQTVKSSIVLEAVKIAAA